MGCVTLTAFGFNPEERRLQQQLDAANRRIAELEAENSDLKRYLIEYRNNEMVLLSRIGYVESSTPCGGSEC